MLKKGYEKMSLKRVFTSSVLLLIIGLMLSVGSLPAAASSNQATASHVHTIPAATKSVVVPANVGPQGVSLVLYIQPRLTYQISAGGSAMYGYEGASQCHGYPTTDPTGQRYINGVACGPKTDPNAVYPGYTGLLLYGTTCSGTISWHPVGTYVSFQSTCYGQLYLLYNDSVYTNNTGSYSALVQYTCYLRC